MCLSAVDLQQVAGGVLHAAKVVVMLCLLSSLVMVGSLAVFHFYLLSTGQTTREVQSLAAAQSMQICNVYHPMQICNVWLQVLRRQSCSYLDAVPRGVFPFKRDTAGDARVLDAAAAAAAAANAAAVRPVTRPQASSASVCCSSPTAHIPGR